MFGVQLHPVGLTKIRQLPLGPVLLLNSTIEERIAWQESIMLTYSISSLSVIRGSSIFHVLI